MRSREMLERLKAADRSLAEERMPRAGSRRVARRISKELESQSGPSRMGWIPMLTFVAGAALVLLFLRWGAADEAPLTSHEAKSPAMTVQVSGPACRSQSDETTKVWGACSISTAGPSMSIDTIEASQLEVAGRVVHLRAGSALFDVEPVHGEPVRVAIPQGEIVVVGTRFRVVVGAERSEVELYEGRLEFRDLSGQVTPILAGQLVGFGEAVMDSSASPEPPVGLPNLLSSEPAPAAAAPASPTRRRSGSKKNQPATERDAGPVIEAAERLRREGRYTEAAATLRAALKRRWPTRTAEVLSHELGRLLERRIRDKASACAHWRKHLERFKKTRDRTRIERSMNELGCE